MNYLLDATKNGDGPNAQHNLSFSSDNDDYDPAHDYASHARLLSPTASVESVGKVLVVLKRSQRGRCKARPMRAVPAARSWSLKDRAQAGIFVVDPVHRAQRTLNREFLHAFADMVRANADALAQTGRDMSFMGFTASSASSGEDDQHHPHTHLDWDQLDPDAIHAARPRAPKKKASPPKRDRPASAVQPPTAGLNVIASSSMDRSRPNSDSLPVRKTMEEVALMQQHVDSNYRNYPQGLRHGSTPMDIRRCPGAQLLTDEEFAACCCLRMRPALFFHARNTLLHNYHHGIGYFKKSAAQKMLRIDVNKTGKLYDFLVKEGWLPADESGECRAEAEQVIVEDDQILHQL